jgi:hypothetical protein
VPIPSVQLDTEVELAPQTIDLLVVNLRVELEPGEAIFTQEPQEPTLTSTPRPLRAALDVEDFAKEPDPRPSLVASDLFRKLLLGGAPPKASFRNDRLELVRIFSDRRAVKDRPGRADEPQPFPGADVSRVKRRPVNDDLWANDVLRKRDGDPRMGS